MAPTPLNPADDGLPTARETGDEGPDLHALRVGRTAMACRFELVFNAGEHADATAQAIEALDLVDAIESRLTVYRDDSELARINRSAHSAPQPVADDLFSLLVQCQNLHARTGGAFDIAVGTLLRTWGFHQRQGRMPDPGSLAAGIEHSGMRHVFLDEASKTVRFDREGIELNLGAIGKGWAVDRAVELVADRLGGGSFLVHGGQSSVRAVGSQASLSAPSGWRVGVVHPLRPSLRLATLRLTNRAIGTSGSGTQFFVDRGRRLGHILDPRRGAPAEGVLSATVIAPTAAEADSLATALYVLGPEGLATIAPRGGDVNAALVVPARSAAAVRLLLANMPEEMLEIHGDAPVERVEAV